MLLGDRRLLFGPLVVGSVGAQWRLVEESERLIGNSSRMRRLQLAGLLDNPNVTVGIVLVNVRLEHQETPVRT